MDFLHLISYKKVKLFLKGYFKFVLAFSNSHINFLGSRFEIRRIFAAQRKYNNKFCILPLLLFFINETVVNGWDGWAAFISYRCPLMVIFVVVYAFVGPVFMRILLPFCHRLLFFVLPDQGYGGAWGLAMRSLYCLPDTFRHISKSAPGTPKDADEGAGEWRDGNHVICRLMKIYDMKAAKINAKYTKAT